MHWMAISQPIRAHIKQSKERAGRGKWYTDTCYLPHFRASFSTLRLVQRDDQKCGDLQKQRRPHFFASSMFFTLVQTNWWEKKSGYLTLNQEDAGEQHCSCSRRVVFVRYRLRMRNHGPSISSTSQGTSSLAEEVFWTQTQRTFPWRHRGR